MPMTTSNVPHLRETVVAEARKTDPPKTDPPKTAAAPTLARAAESGDPTVQRLLALIETHESNGDKDKVDETRRELADLGFK